ncbi:MAG: hypothetical protein K8R36_18840 [Planctomycetales bacterium]|nr:hypothetical protein [Planctomycetales bacterium]
MCRWFQFRLRTAFVAITLLSLPFGWIGGRYHEWQAEELALSTLHPNHVQFDAVVSKVPGTVKLPIFL